MVVIVGDGVAVASVGDVFIQRWKKAATVERGAWASQQRRQHQAHEGASLVMIYVILSSSTPPSSIEREAIQKELSECSNDLRRVLVVPEGNIVWATLVRTIVRTIMMLTKTTQKMTLCASEEESCLAAMDYRSPQTPSPAAIREAMQELAAALP